jgi:hypothetical protein
MTRPRRLVLLAFCLAGVLSPFGFSNRVSARAPIRLANVLLFSNADQSPLITSLGIDREAINLTAITNVTVAGMSLTAFNSTLNSTDVIFIDRYIPDAATYLSLLASHVNGTFGNAGLVMFGFFPDDVGFGSVDVLAPFLPITLQSNISTQISTGDTGDAGYKVQVGVADPLPAGSAAITRHIGWTSCPAASRRLVVDAKPAASKVIEASDIGFEGDSILAEWNATTNGSHVMFYSTIISGNKPFYLWPYFNYLMYVSVFHSIAGYPESAIESYADWPYAPIPNPFQELLWFLLVSGMAAVTIIITVYYKRRGEAEKRIEIQGETR